MPKPRRSPARISKATDAPEEWRRCGIHAERGRITVEDLARHMAAHDVNHIIQVRRLVEQI
jgi:hypothetical protein